MAKRFSKRQLLLLVMDVVIVLLAFNFALFLRLGQTLSSFRSFKELALLACLVLAYAAGFYIFELYDIRTLRRRRDFLPSLGAAMVMALLVGVLVFYVFPYRLGRGVFLISWVLTGLLVSGWRFAYGQVFEPSAPRRSVLILGNGPTVDSVIPGLRHDPEFRLAAIMDRRVMREKLARDAGAGGKGTLEEFVEQNRISDIVVSFEADVSSEMERALVHCRMKGIGCYTAESFYERLYEKLPVLMLDDRWFLMSGGFSTLGNRLYETLKRGADFAVSGFLLLVTLPVSAVIALLVPLTSRGPIFFTQDRLGAGKVPFRIIKFRTMVHDAEAEGPKWARDNDLRVTKLGGLLRKTRLDEIPQLINVLKGEMSLIGPRPEREYFVTRLAEKIPFYDLRFFVKPGLTGWAQVKFRYAADETDALEKLRYELYYIKHQSLVLEAKILMKTVRVILTGLGT